MFRQIMNGPAGKTCLEPVHDRLQRRQPARAAPGAATGPSASARREGRTRAPCTAAHARSAARTAARTGNGCTGKAAENRTGYLQAVVASALEAGP